MRSALYTNNSKSELFAEYSGQRVYPLGSWMSFEEGKPEFIRCYVSSDIADNKSILAERSELSVWKDVN